MTEGAYDRWPPSWSDSIFRPSFYWVEVHLERTARMGDLASEDVEVELENAERFRRPSWGSLSCSLQLAADSGPESICSHGYAP